MTSPPTNIVYAILYIHMDKAEYSEILGVFTNKEDAVDELLKKANFRERNGKLTYYMEPTEEYESFSFLKDKVMEEMELHDLDIYRITKLSLK